MNFLCDLCLVLVPDAGRESHESELSRELARLVWRISSSVSWATCRVLWTLVQWWLVTSWRVTLLVMEHAAKLVWLSDTTSASSTETSLYQTGVTKGKVIPEDVNFLSDFIEVWTKSLTFSLKVMFLSCRSRSEADTPLCPRLQLLILPYLSPILPNLFVTFLGLKHVSCVDHEKYLTIYLSVGITSFEKTLICRIQLILIAGLSN